MRRLTTVFLVLSCFSCAACNIKSIENDLGLGGGKSVTVVIDPKTQNVVVATAQQFAATVTGSSNTVVAWSVGGAGCSTQDCGSISAAGLYTAPATIPNPALVTVTATANANSADYGAAAVTVIAAPASAMLRGSYTFLLSGSDAEGPLYISGTFEAADSSRLLKGRIGICRDDSPCSDQAFAGTSDSSDANNGIFAADTFPASTFTFSSSPNGIFKLDLTGSHNLRASGILRPNATSADKPLTTNTGCEAAPTICRN
ncbi:MAG: hypothetical protein WCE52_18915 [Candidatus Acidiferrum sp.]